MEKENPDSKEEWQGWSLQDLSQKSEDDSSKQPGDPVVKITEFMPQKITFADDDRLEYPVISIKSIKDHHRDIQQQLKQNGHPWEMAKAFDKSCPISPFISSDEFSDLQDISFSLTINGEIRQQGNSKMMMYGIVELINYICKYFTLLKGDVVLTGTPSGVGALNSQDKLQLELNGKYHFTTQVL